MSPFSRFAHYFIAVARCGSLRRAAEQLHISASAINRQILQAEEAFGTPLFERLPGFYYKFAASEPQSFFCHFVTNLRHTAN